MYGTALETKFFFCENRPKPSKIVQLLYSVSQENPNTHSTMRVRILLGHTVQLTVLKLPDSGVFKTPKFFESGHSSPVKTPDKFLGQPPLLE